MHCRWRPTGGRLISFAPVVAFGASLRCRATGFAFQRGGSQRHGTAHALHCPTALQRANRRSTTTRRRDGRGDSTLRRRRWHRRPTPSAIASPQTRSTPPTAPICGQTLLPSGARTPLLRPVVTPTAASVTSWPSTDRRSTDERQLPPRQAIAVITMDDGKVNVLGPAMLAEINRRSTGPGRRRQRRGPRTGNHKGVQRRFRPEGVRIRDPQAALDMLRRVSSCPTGSCRSASPWWRITRHAIAMGAFLACSVDHRLPLPATSSMPMRWSTAW